MQFHSVETIADRDPAKHVLVHCNRWAAVLLLWRCLSLLVSCRGFMNIYLSQWKKAEQNFKDALTSDPNNLTVSDFICLPLRTLPCLLLLLTGSQQCSSMCPLPGSLAWCEHGTPLLTYLSCLLPFPIITLRQLHSWRTRSNKVLPTASRWHSFQISSRAMTWSLHAAKRGSWHGFLSWDLMYRRVSMSLH